MVKTNFKDEFIERIKKAEKGKFIRVDDFSKHCHLLEFEHHDNAYR